MFTVSSARAARQRLMARLALGASVCFAGSVLAPSVQAITYRPPKPAGHVRALSPAEMQRIVGAQMTLNPDAGIPYRWEGASATDPTGLTNTYNGNKLTHLPLVGWTAKGGLNVGFTLYHNSRGNRNRELGQKWTHSYDLYLVVDSATGNASMHWGHDRSYTFVRNLDGSFTPPAGIDDILQARGNPITLYKLTTKDQTSYQFTNPSGAGWYCTSISDRNDNTLTLTRNSGGLVTSVADASGRALSLAYDASNRISSVTDPLNRRWTLAYNASGDLTQITFPSVGGNSYRIAYGYNANHYITRYTDLRNNAWTFGYNSDGSLTSRTDPLGHVTSYSYTGDQRTITDANGRTTTHTYDASGRLASVADAEGHTASYGYDDSNNKTQVTDKRGNVWGYTYDERGNVLTKTDPLQNTTSYTYNRFDQVLSVTTPNGSQVTNTYDFVGNLLETQQGPAGGGALSTTSYTYHTNAVGITNGLVATKTDGAGHTTSYGYDSNGNLTSVTTPNGRVTGFGYNALGLPTSRTDAMGRATTYTRDSWNRVTATNYPGGTSHTFAYDPGSNLTSFTDGTGTTSRSYDALGRMTSESKSGNTTTYTYDAPGQKGLLSSLTDPSGRTMSYTYTARNQLASVSDPAGATSYAYDPSGNETNVTNPNGTQVVKAFDEAGRLSSITNQDGAGATLSSFSYGYNADSLRTSCVEADGSVVSWNYDEAHRLIGESRSGDNAYSAGYSLDGASNRTSQAVNDVTTDFTYSADDELLGTSGGFTNSYGYNANGEQTSRTLSGTAYTLSYDHDGQITQIAGGGNMTRFAYDALGRRVSRTAGGVTTDFLYAGSRVLLEKQGTAVSAVYTYGNALIRKDREFPLFDGLGSERTVTDAGQNITGSISFDAFGQTVASSGSSSNPYLFAATSGYRNDGDAGLVHVGARYYDPQVGRFVTRDTYLDQKPYLYCEHDPVNRIDPSGHDYVDIGYSTGFLEAGVFIDDQGGVYPYVGGGITLPGGSISWSPSDVSPGEGTWELGLGVVSVGTDFSGNSFAEIGWPGSGISFTYIADIREFVADVAVDVIVDVIETVQEWL